LRQPPFISASCHFDVMPDQVSTRPGRCPFLQAVQLCVGTFTAPGRPRPSGGKRNGMVSDHEAGALQQAFLSVHGSGGSLPIADASSIHFVAKEGALILCGDHTGTRQRASAQYAAASTADKCSATRSTDEKDTVGSVALSSIPTQLRMPQMASISINCGFMVRCAPTHTQRTRAARARVPPAS
jgi:hypothetical protein